MKKTVANGTADTDREAEIYEKKQRENAPVMNWKMPAAEEDRTPSASGSGSSLPQASSAKDSSGTSKPAARGWGNIKLRM